MRLSHAKTHRVAAALKIKLYNIFRYYLGEYLKHIYSVVAGHMYVQYGCGYTSSLGER